MSDIKCQTTVWSAGCRLLNLFSFLQIHWLQACRMTADSAAADCNSCAVIYTLLKSDCLRFLTETNNSHQDWRNGEEQKERPWISAAPEKTLKNKNKFGIQPNVMIANHGVTVGNDFQPVSRGVSINSCPFGPQAAQKKNLLRQFVLWLLVEHEVCPSGLVWKGSFLNSFLVWKTNKQKQYYLQHI